MKRGVLAALVAILLAACLPTDDVRWFGWVTEHRAQHRVCGSAHQLTTTTATGSPRVQASSKTWFQGWGTSDPGCYYPAGDLLPGGWMGSRVRLAMDGYYCADSGWKYNSGSTTAYTNYTTCYNYAQEQEWITQGYHRWWAYDSNNYAEANAWTPRGNA